MTFLRKIQVLAVAGTMFAFTATAQTSQSSLSGNATKQDAAAPQSSMSTRGVVAPANDVAKAPALQTQTQAAPTSSSQKNTNVTGPVKAAAKAPAPAPVARPVPTQGSSLSTRTAAPVANDAAKATPTARPAGSSSSSKKN